MSAGKYDAEYGSVIGLSYLNARYLDAALGRFLSPDIWYPTTEGVDVNRYAYAGNDATGPDLELLRDAAMPPGACEPNISQAISASAAAPTPARQPAPTDYVMLALLVVYYRKQRLSP